MDFLNLKKLNEYHHYHKTAILIQHFLLSHTLPIYVVIRSLSLYPVFFSVDTETIFFYIDV